MRILTNSLLAGQLLAAFLTQVVFLLNPHIPLETVTLLRVWAPLAGTYGLITGLAMWLLLALIEQIRGRRLRPAWLSFRLLIWLLILDLWWPQRCSGTTSFTTGSTSQPDTIRSIAISATTLSAISGRSARARPCSITLSADARLYSATRSLFTTWWSRWCYPLHFGPAERRISRGSAPCLSKIVPLPRRLTIIGIEGASMSYVLPAIAEGKLPNFARLIEGGASGALREHSKPTESLAVWTSIATGKLPRQHGLHGFYRYRFFGEQPPFSSTAPWCLLPQGWSTRG